MKILLYLNIFFDLIPLESALSSDEDVQTILVIKINLFQLLAFEMKNLFHLEKTYNFFFPD